MAIQEKVMKYACIELKGICNEIIQAAVTIMIMVWRKLSRIDLYDNSS
jgi:hypothetical protein